MAQRWALASGALVIVPPRREHGRPFGAVLSLSEAGDGSRSFVPFPGFWLVLRETPRGISR